MRSVARYTSSVAREVRWCLLLFALPFSVSVTAQPRSPIFQSDGLALRGYDVVSYFEGKVEPGVPEFQATHREVTWRFASARHRDLFLADPARYEPQYGGYCSVGMAHGGAVPTDPKAFTVHRGKLYLNANLATRTTWAYEPDWMIERADPNWVRWLERAKAASTGTEGPRAPRPVPDSLLAYRGMDVTSYFEAGGLQVGDSTITTTWQGKRWRFRSADARARFVAAPEQFAPRFGGLSPLILAHGDKVAGDPALFTVVDGRVYLDIAPGPQLTFRRNAARLVARADSVWRTMR